MRSIRAAALALALSLAPALAPIPALTSRAEALPPLPEPRPGTVPQAPPGHDIEAEFTIYLGGFLFAVGNFKANLEGDAYRLNTVMGTAGLPRAFYEARFELSSEGRFDASRVRPHIYVSNSWEKKSSGRKVTLDYDAEGMPHLTAVPPDTAGDMPDVMPSQQIETQDPVSAAIVPVAGGTNPCNRSIPVFDGRRRYDLKLSYDSETKLTPHGFNAPLDVIACNIRYVPVAPIEKRKFTDMLRRNDSMKIWLAPFDGGRVYMPVRFQLRTPLGGAVMELTHLSERTASAVPR